MRQNLSLENDKVVHGFAETYIGNIYSADPAGFKGLSPDRKSETHLVMERQQTTYKHRLMTQFEDQSAAASRFTKEPKNTVKDVESAVRLLLSVLDSEFGSAAPPGGTKEASRRARDVRQGGFLRTNLF